MTKHDKPSYWSCSSVAFILSPFWPPKNVHIPSKVTFEDDFPFPKVGYVSSLEGISSFSEKLGIPDFQPMFFLLNKHLGQKKRGEKTPWWKNQDGPSDVYRSSEAKRRVEASNKQKNINIPFPETKSLHLKINAWKTILSFLDFFHVLGGYIKFLGCIWIYNSMEYLLHLLGGGGPGSGWVAIFFSWLGSQNPQINQWKKEPRFVV